MGTLEKKESFFSTKIPGEIRIIARRKKVDQKYAFSFSLSRIKYGFRLHSKKDNEVNPGFRFSFRTVFPLPLFCFEWALVSFSGFHGTLLGIEVCIVQASPLLLNSLFGLSSYRKWKKIIKTCALDCSLIFFLDLVQTHEWKKKSFIWSERKKKEKVRNNYAGDSHMNKGFFSLSPLSIFSLINAHEKT